MELWWAGGDWFCSFSTQAPEPELGEQYEAVCDPTYSEAESAAAEVLDLPLPSYFRSRSHSYLRAIQAGCSQEEDTGSVRSISPPPAGSLSGSRTLPTNSSECSGTRREGKGHEACGDGGCCCQPPGRCQGREALGLDTCTSSHGCPRVLWAHGCLLYAGEGGQPPGVPRGRLELDLQIWVQKWQTGSGCWGLAGLMQPAKVQESSKSLLGQANASLSRE